MTQVFNFWNTTQQAGAHHFTTTTFQGQQQRMLPGSRFRLKNLENVPMPPENETNT